MFFILGARDREVDISAGYFLCPACGQLRRYTLKRLTRYFTLYFLPLFPIARLGETVQCQTCQRTFRADELQAAARLVSEPDLLNAMRVELGRGLALHRLQRRLAQDGLERAESDRLVQQVTRGRHRTCPRCEFAYVLSVGYCTNCGHALSAPESGTEIKLLD
jgi:hypothetical protein